MGWISVNCEEEDSWSGERQEQEGRVGNSSCRSGGGTSLGENRAFRLERKADALEPGCREACPPGLEVWTSSCMVETTADRNVSLKAAYERVCKWEDLEASVKPLQHLRREVNKDQNSAVLWKRETRSWSPDWISKVESPSLRIKGGRAEDASGSVGRKKSGHVVYVIMLVASPGIACSRKSRLVFRRKLQTCDNELSISFMEVQFPVFGDVKSRR